MTEQNKIRYAQALKHPDVEEHIDLWFYRPMGFRLALLGEKLGWTPNLISVISIFLGVGCGLLLYPADWRLNLLGMLMLVLADICDSADGQLARMTRQYSRLGRILDGACGDIWFITIYVCLCLRGDALLGPYIWLIASLAGLSHRQQASLADYYRNVHLFFVNGKKGSELDDSRQVATDYSQISFSKEPLYKVFMWMYHNYTVAQEKLTPSMQRLRLALAERYADSPIPNSLSEAFRKESKPLMKYCNALTFNWRAITIFVTLMLGVPYVYFIIEITVGNLIYWLLRRRHERICVKFADIVEQS
ncbi:MAG: CDP-alcohol phosphatidyltransferase family protein [Bacteroidales bacterium]|nr:CDP-alcohol phosphatidyltransferase family protein [Candidatus Liminaster caballi]